MLILPLTACNGGEEILKGYKLPQKREEGTTVELVVHETYTDEEHEVFLNIINMFTEDNPEIAVKVERAPRGAQWSRLTQALATNETPDIARVDMEYITTLVDTQAILPLELLWESGDWDDYIPGAILSNTYQDRVWGIPDQVNTSVLFYNRTLLSEAGASIPSSQWIWNDLIEVSKKVNDITPETLGYAFGSTLWEVIPYLGSYGATIFDENGVCVMDSAKALKALGFLHQNGWTQEPLGTEQLFIDQKSAMIISGLWSIPEIEYAEIDYGLTTVPNGTAGSVSNIDGTSMVIFKNTEHPREAYKFLRYLTSREVQNLWSKELGQIPVNQGSFQDVDLDKYPYLEVFMEQIVSVMPRPTLSNYAQVEELFNEEFASALKGDKDLEQALREVASKINETQ